MELVEALEAYLLDTKQIHPLARRQAILLSRSLENKDLESEARIVLLLNLAALHRGAPRPPKSFLLAMLEPSMLERYIQACVEDGDGSRPAWATTLMNPESIQRINTILENVIDAPVRLFPLTGTPPLEGVEYPVLVTGKNPESRTGFSRYWVAAAQLEKGLKALLGENPGTQTQTIADSKAREIISRIFGTDSLLEEGKRFHYRQIAAAVLALRQRLLIVSGGPGTGKTSVVIQILRTLAAAFDHITADRIVLCAPTGRAKTRLGEAVDQGIEKLEQKPAVGEPTSRTRDLALKKLQRRTVHGLLGIGPNGKPRYNSRNPLPYQMIVVDEASMVDLVLFAALIEAAPPDCRIILLGDMHQLPSVEAGAVLGDLTARFSGLGTGRYPSLSAETADWIQTITRDVQADGADETGKADLVLSTAEMRSQAGLLADHAIILSHTYRSSREIAELSESVNRGDWKRTQEQVGLAGRAGGASLDIRKGLGSVTEWLKHWYCEDAQSALQRLETEKADITSLMEAFAILDSSRILTLAHEGLRGRIAINNLAGKLLKPKLGRGSDKRFFHGQPVMLEQNHYELDLYNGDTGLVLQTRTGGLRAVFRRGNRFMMHALERLAGLEPAFAMTVHKAQGSEFDSVLLVLPEHPTPLMTRRIIYTGLTRARKRISILGSEDLLQLAINTSPQRPGGIQLG